MPHLRMLPPHGQHIFQARTNGYYNYRVPGIAKTRNGVLLATAEARRGSGGDWDGNDILLRRSLDNGTTWEAPQLVVGHDQNGPGPISNFVLIPNAIDGSIHALYCHNYARIYSMRSSDDGASFSDPIDIRESLEAFRGLQLEGDCNRTWPWNPVRK